MSRPRRHETLERRLPDLRGDCGRIRPTRAGVGPRHLHREACAFPQLPMLAAKLAFLTEWLLADMLEEERSLLVPDVVRDDVVVIDQASG